MSHKTTKRDDVAILAEVFVNWRMIWNEFLGLIFIWGRRYLFFAKKSIGYLYYILKFLSIDEWKIVKFCQI